MLAVQSWEDQMTRERTGHPPSYAEAKKTKLLRLHTHGLLIGLAQVTALLSSVDLKSNSVLRNVYNSASAYESSFISVLSLYSVQTSADF